MWQIGVFVPDQGWRIVTYPFVHLSITHALFVIVFTLALGNLIAHQFRPWAVIALFFGSAIGGADLYAVRRAFAAMALSAADRRLSGGLRLCRRLHVPAVGAAGAAERE